MRVQSSPHQRLWSETEADDLPQRARRSPSPPGPQTTAPTVCDAPPEPSNAPFWAAGQPLQQSLLDQLPPSEHLSATTPAPAPAPTAPTPGADAYTGEPAVPAQWLQERQAALDALRNEHDAQRNQAMATAPSPGYIGPGWVEVTLCPDESGQLLNPSGRPTVRVVDPDAPPVVIGHDEGGLIYGAAPGRDFEFSDEAFAAHHRAQVQAGAADHAALRTLARLYGTDAASVMAAQPQLWQLTQGEHALNAGPPPAGHAMADAGQLGMLDLYLADPQVAELVSIHGGTVEPARSDIAQEQVRLYGAQRYGQLSRLGNAMHTVRQLYSDAMQQAEAGGGQGWVQRQRSITVNDEGGAQTTLLSERVFDPDVFTDWYLQQDGIEHQAFASFYGRSHTRYTSDEAGRDLACGIDFDNPSWQMDGVLGGMRHKELVLLDPNHAPRLNDNAAVGFDLQAGWATHKGNIHQEHDWVKTVVQVAIVAAVSYLSFNTLGPQAAAAMGYTSGTGAAVVSAAVAGAMGSAASGVVNDNLSFKSVLQGALSAALTAGLMQGANSLASSWVGKVDVAGQMVIRGTVQGGIQALLGGNFKDGVAAGFASGLADYLGAGLASGIDKAALSTGEAMAAHALARVFTSAVRALGSPDNPQYAFASELVSSAINAGLDAAARPAPGTPSLAGAALDDEGNLMPGVVDANAPPAVQAAQLAAQLERQGLDADEAAAQAVRAVGAAMGTLPSSASVDAPPDSSPATQADGGFDSPQVVIVGQRPRFDGLGNRYLTDAAGNTLVLLAEGSMLSLGRAIPVPLSGGLVVPGAALLRAITAAAPAALAGLALGALPANFAAGATTVDLGNGLRFEEPGPGGLWGRLIEQQRDGSWQALDGRYFGQRTAAGYTVISEDEVLRLQQPITTPMTPPPGSSLPPLPAWAGKHEPLPPYPATQPTGPVLETYPAEPAPDWRDLLVHSDANADNNRDLALERQRRNPTLQDPRTLEGSSGPGGLGTWAYPGTPRSEGAAADYQEQVSGKPWGLEINLGGTQHTTTSGTPTLTGGKWFDDVRIDGDQVTVWVDAKHWGGFELPDQRWWLDNVVADADSGVRALERAGMLDKARIEWPVSTEAAAQAIDRALENGLTVADRNVITIVVVPPKK